MKAQIEFNTIVKLILAILVLVTVILLFSGTSRILGSGLSRQATSIGNQVDLVNTRSTCTTYCLSMNTILATKEDAKNQPYCSVKFSLIEDGDANDEDRCYDSLITGGSECKVILQTGSEAIINEEACQGTDDFGRET